MSTAYHDYWPIIRENVVNRINANGTAEVYSVMFALRQGGIIPEWHGVAVIGSEDIQTIIAPLLESRIYTAYYKNEQEVYISKSTSYEMEEITKKTNITLQEANASTAALNEETKKYYSQLKWATWVIAGATIANIIVSLYK